MTEMTDGVKVTAVESLGGATSLSDGNTVVKSETKKAAQYGRPAPDMFRMKCGKEVAIG